MIYNFPITESLGLQVKTTRDLYSNEHNFSVPAEPLEALLREGVRVFGAKDFNGDFPFFLVKKLKKTPTQAFSSATKKLRDLIQQNHC